MRPRAGAVPGTLALPRRCREGGTGVPPVFGDGVESSSLRSQTSRLHGRDDHAPLFSALAEDQWVLTPDPLTAIQLRLD